MMRRSACCNDHHEMGLNKGSWTPNEDQKLVTYVQNHGHGVWRVLPKLAGILTSVLVYILDSAGANK